MFDPTIHVLSTRPLDEALIGLASQARISIDVVPFIMAAAVEDDSLRDAVAALDEKPLTAVFTSSNAVEAVAGWTEGAEAWEIFCIGAATREMVSRYFGDTSIVDTADSAAALAEKIIRWGGEQRAQPVGSKEVFFFCGDQRREELPAALQKAGITVNEYVVYRTEATPHKTEREYSGVVFFSPSAVESFFSMNAVAAGVILFAIGQTTASSIRQRCENLIIVSERPDASLLIGKVIEYFQQKNSQY